MTVEAVALAFLLLREGLLVAALGLAFSGIDDLIVDAVFAARAIGRRWAGRPPVVAEAMGTGATGWFAIIVPAWDEAAVIGHMLRGMTGALDHPRYRVFVGCYPNDPATLAAIIGVGDKRIIPIVTSNPGPTTKADCLNHLWRALVADEAANGRRFKAVVLHDAEDVVHPRELAVFDHLMPRLALVQLPVEPLPDAGSRWIAGHYLDEFAESHAKDVIVREALGAAVPSAGVACAIERGLLGRIARAQPGGEPFDPACFTEDYELGLRVKRLGGRGALVRVRDRAGGLVACREHFPATLDTAVKQKARWMLGIALSGWDRMGWADGFADNYMLWRDRKPLFTGPLLLLAYATMFAGLLAAAFVAAVPGAQYLPPIAPEGGWLQPLLIFNGMLLGWRLSLRAAFTTHAHGWREGVRAVPRALVSNLVNLLATWRAVSRYLGLALGGGALAWEKTAHRYPVPAG